MIVLGVMMMMMLAGQVILSHLMSSRHPTVIRSTTVGGWGEYLGSQGTTLGKRKDLPLK